MNSQNHRSTLHAAEEILETMNWLKEELPRGSDAQKQVQEFFMHLEVVERLKAAAS
eukprot:SAG31_NODE_165_length_21701_cov_9.786409_12_plen_56_part_00